MIIFDNDNIYFFIYAVCSPGGDSSILYKPGESFNAVKDGKNLDCECDPNAIPRCIERIQITRK